MEPYENKFNIFSRVLAAAGAVLLLFAAALTFFYPRKYAGTVTEVCAEYSVSPALAHAVISVESGYDPQAVSAAGAQGLMQLMPETAAFCASRLGIGFEKEKLADPAYNIRLGVYYLSYLFFKFDSETDVLAAYNAGEGNVRLWKAQGLEEIPFLETRNYVKRVLRAKKIYGLIL